MKRVLDILKWEYEGFNTIILKSSRNIIYELFRDNLVKKQSPSGLRVRE